MRTIADIKHDLLQVEWVINTTTNWKCKKEHEKRKKRLKKELYILKATKNGKKQDLQW